jgi:hypothetical protein
MCERPHPTLSKGEGLGKRGRHSILPHPTLSKGEGFKLRKSAVKVLSFGEDLGEANEGLWKLI